MAAIRQITRQEARRFMLMKHGLIGCKRFSGKAGVMDFVRQVGCIQFDPIDVCGRNPDLVLQSRVQDYGKAMLDQLLYQDRALVDYYDKEMSIFPVADWPHGAPVRAWHQQSERSHSQLQEALPALLAEIRQRGPLSARDIEMHDKVDWYWGSSRLARAGLEHLYYRGELGIHHKRGTHKYYDLIERLLPAEILGQPYPHADQATRQLWQLRRRIGALGLAWDRASAAWLGIADFATPRRRQAFAALTAAGEITPLKVEGLRDAFYCLSADLPLLEQALSTQEQAPRCELIAPLDNLIWDRNLIKALFDFDYTWEIYTTPAKRKYGYYVLPLLQGENFIGRVEPVFDRKTGRVTVKGLWYEPEVKPGKRLTAAVDKALAGFEAFHRRA